MHPAHMFYRMRSLCLLLLAIGALAPVSARPASALDIVRYDSFTASDVTAGGTLNLVESASLRDSAIELVPRLGFQRGAVWHTNGLRIDRNFDVTFQFLIKEVDEEVDTPPGGSDGLAFVMQAVNNTAIGGNKGGIGYDGIPRSVAIEFDTYPNNTAYCGGFLDCIYNDPDRNHISVQTRGQLPNSADHSFSRGSTTDIPRLIDETVHTARILYDEGDIVVFLDDLRLPVLRVTIDLASEIGATSAWFGFTGATGGSFASVNVLNWRVETPALAARLTSPVDNARTGAGSVTLAVQARSNIAASVAQVQFLAQYNGAWQPIGSDTSAPFELTWQIPAALRSQQIPIAATIIDSDGTSYPFLTTANRLNYIESLTASDVRENWLPNRVYLNQRDLQNDGDDRCAAAAIPMLLAMQGAIDSSDLVAQINLGNALYPQLRNRQNLVSTRQIARIFNNDYALVARGSEPTPAAAWELIRSAIDAREPVLLQIAAGTMAQSNHCLVVVGYREQGSVREVIVYDPQGRWLGTCCNNNYASNTTTYRSQVGVWRHYDFAAIYTPGSSLITTRQRERAPLAAVPIANPDPISVVPGLTRTYAGAPIVTEYETLLPSIVR